MFPEFGQQRKIYPNGYDETITSTINALTAQVNILMKRHTAVQNLYLRKLKDEGRAAVVLQYGNDLDTLCTLLDRLTAEETSVGTVFDASDAEFLATGNPKGKTISHTHELNSDDDWLNVDLLFLLMAL